MFYNHGVTSVRATILLLILAAVGCHYSPAYQGAACADREPRCPSGLVCQEGRCLPAPDDQKDGEDAWKEEESVTADEGPLEGEEVSFDDGGQEDAPVGDQSADGGEEAEDGGDRTFADQDDCAGGCPEGYFCDPLSRTCLPCNTFEHCGQSCQACAQGESCLELSENYCCRGQCSGASACQTVACASSGWICSLVFNPEESWQWQVVAGNTYFCTLAPSTTPGHSVPVEGTFQCSQNDASWLEFFCTYDGACADGSCQPIQAARKVHNCGAQFGCDPQRQRCRRYKKDGESCSFNFDCESFCCSRQANAVCVTPSSPNRSECKIVTTEYMHWESGWWQRFTWVAFSDQAPHDIALWHRIDGHHGQECANDYDCDSGTCSGWPDYRCVFSDCVSDKDTQEIRNKYFCSAGVGDGSSAVYIPTVTNNDPLPQDNDCPDRQ